MSPHPLFFFVHHRMEELVGINAEEQLISRIIRSANIREPLEWGITSDDFRSDWGIAAFNHLYGFYTNPGSQGAIMGVEMFRDRMPTFVECDDPGMTTEALCMMVRRNRLAREAEDYGKSLLLELQEDPEPAIARHCQKMQTLLELGGSRSRDISFSEAMPRLWEQYQQAKHTSPFHPISYPWPTLNYETLGIAPDDFIVFYGRPKSGKSWVIAYMIAHMYEQTIAGQHLRILVYTKEMGPDNIFKRILSCLATVDYRKLRHGELGEYDEQALEDVLLQSQKAINKDRLICLQGDLNSTPDGVGNDTVPWFRSKLEKYHPHIAFIDGAYLMNATKSYQKDHSRVAAISRELRSTSLALNIPIIITIQATRSAAQHYKANLDEVAFSDALAQDATAVFRVINEKTEREVNGQMVNTMLLATAGSREWALDGIRIINEPARDFSFLETVSTSEMLKAKELDDQEKAEAKQKRQPVNSSGNETNIRAPAVSAMQKKLVERQIAATMEGDKSKRAPRSK